MMRTLRNPTGASTIIVTLILLFALTALTIGGLSAASSNLQITRNYRTGTQALLAAEAAKIHAHEMISDWGVIRFNNDVLPNWDEIYGSSWREMPGHPGIRYRAEIWEDPNDKFGHLMMRVTGQSPGESTRIIEARLEVDLEFSPGAIYLPGEEVDASFNGNNFLVDGFDVNLDGSMNPDGDVPGITARNKDVKAEVLGSLNGDQKDNVTGDGGDPAVQLSYGPTADRIVNEIVPNILTYPGVVTYPSYTVNGNETFGSVVPMNPQITYFAGDLSVMGNGNASGAGIMIVDGGLKINGDLDFTGLIIVRGTTEITTVSGNASILGAIWTTDLKLTVAGSASVTYSSEAMRLAGSFGPEILPKRTRSVAWKEL